MIDKEKRCSVYLHWCGFSHLELHALYELGKSFQELFDELSLKLLSYYVKNEKRREEIWERFQKKDTKKLDEVMQTLAVEVVCYPDPHYPESLKHISHSPFILYIRGSIPSTDMFAVVGARKISSYGKRAIEKIIPDIAEVFPIVSGGASGCDSEAHKACLESGNPTVVVMGTGINKCYPVGNAQLFEKIIHAGGAIISSFRIGEPGNPYNFPIRNEIVVGLSRGVLVVEAEGKSGSLITAKLTLDYGKDLFAVPGDMFSQKSLGTNTLIKNGEAKLVSQSQDILEEYCIDVKKSQKKDIISTLSADEKEIYTCLQSGGQNFDEICDSLGVETHILLSRLSLMEIKGCVKKDLAGKYFIN